MIKKKKEIHCLKYIECCKIVARKKEARTISIVRTKVQLTVKYKKKRQQLLAIRMFTCRVHRCYRAYLCIVFNPVMLIKLIEARRRFGHEKSQFTLILIASNYGAFTQFTFVLCSFASLSIRSLYALLLSIFFRSLFVCCSVCFLFIFFYFCLVHSDALHNRLKTHRNTNESKIHPIILMKTIKNKNIHINCLHK